MTLYRYALFLMFCWMCGSWGCSSGPRPLPPGPPPEYEQPRTYDAGANIDELGSTEESLLDDLPPPPPPSAAPTAKPPAPEPPSPSSTPGTSEPD